MNESPKVFPRRFGEAFFSAISIGFLLVVVGAIFVTAPDLFDKISVFLSNFDLVPLPNQPGLLVPAPVFPRAHLLVYGAVEQFSLTLGLFQIVVLVLRFVASSMLSKKAETLSNLVFWLGTSFLTRMFLIEITMWFVFWAGIIMLIGVSLIIRTTILLLFLRYGLGE